MQTGYRRNIANRGFKPKMCKTMRLMDQYINVGGISTDEDMKDIDISDIQSETSHENESIKKSKAKWLNRSQRPTAYEEYLKTKDKRIR